MSDYTEVQNYLELAQASNDQWFKDRALNRAADEITTLRQKLEQAEARCAELGQYAKNAAGSIIRTVNSRRKTILIKQAEAIEAWLNGDAEMGGLDDYANRLRQQATEMESGDNDD